MNVFRKACTLALASFGLGTILSDPNWSDIPLLMVFTPVVILELARFHRVKVPPKNSLTIPIWKA